MLRFIAMPPLGRTLAILTTLLLAVGSPVLGDSETTRAERERVRAEAATLAAELDPLMAEDAQLEQAVQALTAEVDAQQAKVDAVRASIAATQARQRELRVDIETAERDRDTILDRVRELAVSEYMGSEAGEHDRFWAAPDLNAASRQRGLVETVTDSEVDAVDQLRSVEADLEVLAAAEAAAQADLESLEADRVAQLDELAVALAEQERLQVALDARIAEFVADADALAAEEAELTALLAKQVADEEAAAAAAAAAATPVINNPDVGPPTAPPSSSDPAAAPSAPSAPANPGPSLAWPASGVVTSGFGPRWGRMHQGIDIAAASGTPVYAAAGGVVVTAGYNGGYGNWVVIDHGSGLSTVYAHHSELFVSAGQSVSGGTQLGLMGSTGNSTGPHVHFEVRVNGTPYDPMAYLG